jgi:hypothetical protein
MNIPKTVSEEFLCFIWENRLYFADNLKTIDNELLEIIHPGRRNSHSGPDFFNAKIKIGETLWAGNIEIHKKASDWERHHHSGDKAYENVILHVVEQADRQIMRENGTKISTFERHRHRRLRTGGNDSGLCSWSFHPHTNFGSCGRCSRNGRRSPVAGALGCFLG